MTELSQNERDERLAGLAARGRVARPTAESHEPTDRRAAPAATGPNPGVGPWWPSGGAPPGWGGLPTSA